MTGTSLTEAVNPGDDIDTKSTFQVDEQVQGLTLSMDSM